MNRYRIERDTLGEMRVPATALYGAQTQRAMALFPVSGMRLPASFIHALGLIKQAAAQVNADLDFLDPEPARVIMQAAGEVASGQHDAHFPLDVFQTGSGTSTNMNANEVIARRASQLLDKKAGAVPIHPNDHVNQGQSSNDVIPTAMHLSTHLEVSRCLLPALHHLAGSIRRRAHENAHIIKTGRTHLVDAMPISLGQEMGGWAAQIGHAIEAP